MPIGHLYVFFGEMSIQTLCPLSNWVGVFDVKLFEFFVDFRY